VTKPRIRLFNGWYALVRYPGAKLQRDFGCYVKLADLLAVIAATPPPDKSEAGEQ
jgi:hypothetical protein